MILDAIIGVIVSILAAIADAALSLTVPLINLVLGGIEAVVGIFVSGFTLGRIKRREKDDSTSHLAGAALLILVTGAILYFLIAPRIMNREITLIAEDGHSLPFAALVVHTRDGEEHRRTDNAGNVVVPRFRTTAITVNDPRYIEATWEKPDLESPLIVKRTLLGAGLDQLAERLMQPGKNKADQ